MTDRDPLIEAYRAAQARARNYAHQSADDQELDAKDFGTEPTIRDSLLRRAIHEQIGQAGPFAPLEAKDEAARTTITADIDALAPDPSGATYAAQCAVEHHNGHLSASHLRAEAELARAGWNDPRLDLYEDQRLNIRDSAPLLDQAATALEELQPTGFDRVKGALHPPTRSDQQVSLEELALATIQGAAVGQPLTKDQQRELLVEKAAKAKAQRLGVRDPRAAEHGVELD